MPLHRKDAPTYIGGLPGTHDRINNPAANGDPGVPALTDGKLSTSGHPNQGTYYIGFGEDGTSQNGNRAHDALAESTDFLDDVVSGGLAAPANVDGVALAALSSLVIIGDVFVGMSGTYTPTTPFFERLIKVLDNTTGNDLVDASGVKIEVTAIRENTNVTNVVGAAISPGQGFETNPTINFSPAIPMGASYRILYGKRTTLVAGIRTQVDQDFLLRHSIRGGHQASAEVIRFITQASRRTGGNITALSASLIETPRGVAAPGGSILPAANTFTIDIDSTDAFAFNGFFDVSFDRDGTPKSLFSVREGTGAGESVWQNTAEAISLVDANTLASGFALTRIPLSSSTAASGDDNLRLMENDPAGTAHSVLKAVNGRLSVTCGDGTNTFGDFNGSTALNAALNFAIAAGVLDFHVQLKPGTYTLNAVNFTGLSSVTIEGTEPNACVIESLSASFGLQTENGTGQSYTFRNVSFTETGGGAEAIRCRDTRLVMENCIFVDTQLRYQSVSASLPTEFGDFAVRLVSCRWLNGTTGRVPVIIEGPAAAVGDVEGFFFEDCLFSPPAADTPAVRIVNALAAGTSVLRGIEFRRCKFNLGSTTDDGGGDYNGNSGVLELDHGANSNLEIGDITWRDCFVRVRSSPSAVQVLLYFRMGDGSSNNIITRDLNIIGGRWEVQDADSALTPFYIGGETTSSAVLSPVHVSIQDVEWGIDTPVASRDYGDAPAELSFGGGVDQWAQFVILCDRLHIRNVRYLGNVARGQSGQLYLRTRVWDVDGIEVAGPYIDTAQIGAFPPRHQVHLETVSPGIQTRGTIKNLTVASFPVITNNCGFFGIVWCRPNGYMRLENCYVTGFTNTSDTAIGQFGSASSEGGLQLINCHVDNCAIGYGYSYTTGDQALEDTLITGCLFENCGLDGIRIFGTGTAPAPRSLTIANCIFRSNAGEGIDIQPGAAYSISFPGLVISDNVFYDNSGASSNDQIDLGEPGSLQGSICGNIAASSGAGMGICHFSSATPNNCHNTETGWDSSGANITFVGQRDHSALALMMHNNMRYSEA